jgi:hypothetical protein
MIPSLKAKDYLEWLPHPEGHEGINFRRLGFPYIERVTTRHGRKCLYVRAPGRLRVRIREEFGTPDFTAAYRAAMLGQTPPARDRKSAAALRVGKRAGDIGRALVQCLRGAKGRGRLAGREFALTLDWAIAEVERAEFKCALSGIDFYTKHDAQSFRNPFAPSIDRINAAKGYVPDNCRIVVVALNIGISDWGEAVFEKIARGYLRGLRRKSSP